MVDTHVSNVDRFAKNVTADAAGEIDLADADVTASAAARMFYDAARGAKEEATVTAAPYRRQLKRLVRVLSRGLGARG